MLTLAAALPTGTRAQQADTYDRALDLAQANRLAEALAVIDTWRPASAAEAEQRLWARAVLLRQMGRTTEAVQPLETLVARRPDVPRFRTALAEVLEATGQTERAQMHRDGRLTAVTSGADDERQERGLGALIAPRNFSGYLGMSVVPATNPGQKTSARTVIIGGAPFVINNAARKSGAVGINLRGGLTFAPQVTERVGLRFGLSGDADLYDGAAPDDVSLRAQAALSYKLSDATRVEGGLTYSRRFLGGQGYSKGPGLSFGLVHDPDQRSRIEAAAVVDWLTHDTLPGLDGRNGVAVLSYARIVSPRMILRGSARVERVEAAMPSNSASGVGLGVGASYFFASGLQMGLDLSLRQTGYDAASPLYGVRRSDLTGRATLRLTHSKIQARGFAPVIEVEYEERRSNISVYSFDGVTTRLGLTRRF